MPKHKLPPSVHVKAAHLMRKEGMTREQAYGAASGMWREGRLTREGKYKSGKPKRKTLSEAMASMEET